MRSNYTTPFASLLSLVALLLICTPAGAYEIGEGSYEVTEYDVPSEWLDILATALDGMEMEGVTVSEVDMYWSDDPVDDVAIDFHFAGEMEFTVDFGIFGTYTFDVWFSGDYDSIWDADVTSACSIEVENHSDHLYNFSYNVDDVPGFVEQWVEDYVEDKVEESITDGLEDYLPDVFELMVVKDCAEVDHVDGLDGKGKVVVPPSGPTTFEVTMFNSGLATWGAGESTKLGLVGDDQSMCHDYLGGNRWPIQTDVAPGEVGTYAVEASGLEPGQSLWCGLQMVRDLPGEYVGPHWFGEMIVIEVTCRAEIQEVIHAAAGGKSATADKLKK